MKRVWLILLATLGCIAAAQAQRVVIGERVPELKADTWLGGEPEATVTRLLGEKVSPLLVVALGAERDFGNFGVSYIPFGVLVDARNRALWMGNTRTLTVETIEQSLP